MADNNTVIQNDGGVKGLQNAKTQVVQPTYQKIKALSEQIQELTKKLLDTKASMLLKLKEEQEKEAQRLLEESTKQEDVVVEESVAVENDDVIDEEVKDTPKVEEIAQTDDSAPSDEQTVEETSVAEEKPQPKPEVKNEPKKQQEKADVNVISRVFDGKSNDNNQKPNKNTQKPPFKKENGANDNKNNRFNDNKNNNNRNGARPTPAKPFNNTLNQATTAPIPPKDANKNKTNNNKSRNRNNGEEKAGKDKKTLSKQGYDSSRYNQSYDFDDQGVVRVRGKKKSNKNGFNITETAVIESAVMTTPLITIKSLAEKIGKTGSEIIKVLFKVGVMKTINDSIDFDTADLAASEFGVTLTYDPEKTAEDKLQDIQDEEDTSVDSNAVTRPPVVTIMGHVDHGKTSLLDYIRKAHVTAGEAGGITQHIGAYTVTLNGKQITFLDTPGHEAFTSMRLRGAMVTDIAVIVVAADDGIMPQTIEAINHAKLAKVQIIIAVNKMDKPTANPDRVLQQLTEYDLVPEEWGGSTPVVKVSAKTGDGVTELLENILVNAEILELKANPDRKAFGSIIEAKLDKGKGPLATVLVQNGTLKVGDYVVAGTSTGKIRAMIDDKGKNVKTAGPSTPVVVLGFSEVPNAGDNIIAVEDEKLVKQVATERQNKIKDEMNQTKISTNLDDFFAQMKKGETKTLNIIIKADVQGSVEAVKQSLVKLSNDEVKIQVIHGAVGAINESDIMLASTSGAIIIGFNVRPDQKAKAEAERDKIDIRLYSIIYDAIEDVSSAIKGMLAPKFKETILGNAEVRQVYKISGVGAVAGCYVTEGKVARSGKVRLYRNDTLIYDGELASLKRFKDDVKEVAKGYECGMSIVNYNDIKEGDNMEVYIMEQINE